MAAVTIPNAGKYDILVDVGFLVDGFVLDDPIKGVLDNTQYVLDGSTTYASVAEGTLNANMFRGRRDERDAITNGTFTFTLNDTLADGVFNPFDDGSPYFDGNENVPGLAPGRAVQFVRYDDNDDPELQFVGFIVNYNYSFVLGGINTVTVFCVDNMYRLAQTFISAHNPTKELTGARINAILDRTGVQYPTGAARNVATGTVELGGSSQYAIAEGTNVKQYLDFIMYSAERGRIYISRDGVFTTSDRIGFVTGTPVAEFSDQSHNIPYRDLEISFQAEDIINRVAITPAGGTQQLANDATSQAAYFIKSLYIDGSLLHDDSAALTLANYLLEPEPTPRFTAVETWYGNLTAAQRDVLSTMDLGAYITIEKDILVSGVPTALAQNATIEGIEIRLDFAAGHTARYFTSPATVTYQLILNDPVYGVLDGANVLG